ncbi:MAG TPA: hypothetical protein VFQ52_07775 [Rhizomicrobium sp.]|nr:hypothetical protein [Rhizomicrobium sp.]
MKRAAILALAILVTFPALAAGEKKEGGAESKKGGKAGTNVEMPFLMAPLTNEDGKLTGYAYISTRLTAVSEATTLIVRDKIPYIQDAMVRDVNGAEVAAAEDREQVDIPKLEARLLGDAKKVLGAGKVKQITVCTVHIAELHPVQTQAQVAPKDQKPVDAHNNPVKSRCES